MLKKMFLLCKRDVQPVGTDRIYLLQGKNKKKKKKERKKGSDRIWLLHYKIYLIPLR